LNKPCSLYNSLARRPCLLPSHGEENNLASPHAEQSSSAPRSPAQTRLSTDRENASSRCLLQPARVPATPQHASSQAGHETQPGQCGVHCRRGCCSPGSGHCAQSQPCRGEETRRLKPAPQPKNKTSSPLQLTHLTGRPSNKVLQCCATRDPAAPARRRRRRRSAAGRAASQLNKEQRLARHAGQLRRLHHRLDHALVLRAAPRRPSAWPGHRRSPRPL